VGTGSCLRWTTARSGKLSLRIHGSFGCAQIISFDMVHLWSYECHVAVPGMKCCMSRDTSHTWAPGQHRLGKYKDNEKCSALGGNGTFII